MRLVHVSPGSGGTGAGADVIQASQLEPVSGPRFHNAQLVMLVDDGGFSVTTASGDWLARPGAIVVLGPGQVHQLRSQSPRGTSYRMIHWPVTAHGAGFARPVINDPRLAFAVQQTHTLMLHSSAPASALARLTMMLARLAALYGRPEPSAAGPEDADLIGHAQRFLLDRLALPVKLEDVAGHCGVSVFHLARTFRRAVGLPPHAWLTQHRVNRARSLLAAGMALADAAYACGFNDQSHLTRQFRAALGLTPGRYRRAVARAQQLSRRASAARRWGG